MLLNVSLCHTNNRASICHTVTFKKPTTLDVARRLCYVDVMMDDEPEPEKPPEGILSTMEKHHGHGRKTDEPAKKTTNSTSLPSRSVRRSSAQSTAAPRSSTKSRDRRKQKLSNKVARAGTGKVREEAILLEIRKLVGEECSEADLIWLQAFQRGTRSGLAGIDAYRERSGDRLERFGLWDSGGLQATFEMRQFRSPFWAGVRPSDGVHRFRRLFAGQQRTRLRRRRHCVPAPAYAGCRTGRLYAAAFRFRLLPPVRVGMDLYQSLL